MPYATLGWLILVFLGWHRIASEGLPWPVVLCLAALVVTAWLAGDCFLALVLSDAERFDSLPFRLLVGLIALAFALFVASLLLPFTIRIDALILSSVVVFAWWRARGRTPRSVAPAHDPAGTLFVWILPLVVTVWCRVVLQPPTQTDHGFVFSTWPDVFVHYSYIAAFAASHGIGTVSDITMAGGPLRPYHFASYALPALLVQSTGTSALVAYASVLVPFGLLVTGLAAFVIARVAFGPWPALAAGLGVLLIPDAFQQGFGNAFLDFHWLQQVIPAEGYGLASAAIAFALLLEGCRTNRLRLIAWGWAFVVVTLAFKAQIFVAIAYPAFVFPVLCSTIARPRDRFLLLIVFSALFAVVLDYAQGVPGAPAIRPDGSGLVWYSTFVLWTQQAGLVKDVFTYLYALSDGAWLPRAFVFALLLVTCTFGLILPLYVALVGSIRRHFGVVVAWFPLAVVAVYLVMSTSLSIDDHRVGHPEEFMHRPLVWAFFILTAWFAAAAYFRVFGHRRPKGKRAVSTCAALVAALSTVPIAFGSEIQSTTLGNFSYPEVSACRIELAAYIRGHSEVDDVVQDSANDTMLRLTGLTERRPYAADTHGMREPDGVRARLDALNAIRADPRASEVQAFMRARGIRWYVVASSVPLPWEAGAKDKRAFECGNERAYRF